jgi:hypothetical protein
MVFPLEHRPEFGAIQPRLNWGKVSGFQKLFFYLKETYSSVFQTVIDPALKDPLP